MPQNSGTTLYSKFLWFIILIVAISMVPLMAHDLYLSLQNERELVDNTARNTLSAARENLSSHFSRAICIEAGIVQDIKLDIKLAADAMAELFAHVGEGNIASLAEDLARKPGIGAFILFQTGREAVQAAGTRIDDPKLFTRLKTRAFGAAVEQASESMAVHDSSGRLFLAYITPLKQSNHVLCWLFPFDDATGLAMNVQDWLRDSIASILNSLAIYPEGRVHVLNASTLEDFLPSDAPFDPTSRLLLQQALQEGKSFTKIPSATGPLHCYLGSVPGRDWLIAVAVPAHAMRQPVLRMLARQAALLLAIMALAGLAALRLGIVQFRPLGEIIAVVRDFPRQDFTRSLDFSSRLPLGRRDELGDLARALVEMGEMLRKTLDGMLKATAAKERLEGELTAARRIQEGLLPTLTPEFGTHAALELFASMKPARHVGGDLYDFFFVSETKLCVAVGDVAGKGVPAALFMSSAVTLLRGLSHGMDSPAAIVSAINRDLAARNPENMFVTMAVGIYDTRTCVFTFTLAGHPAPALVPGAGGGCRLLDDFTPDLVAGVMADACYHDHKIVLEPGDTLFLYTDGISESPGAQGKFFGQKGILHGLETLRDKALPEVCNGMLRLAENFSRSLPQADDATVLALRRKGNPHG